jgi:hypothetical protein
MVHSATLHNARGAKVTIFPAVCNIFHLAVFLKTDPIASEVFSMVFNILLVGLVMLVVRFSRRSVDDTVDDKKPPAKVFLVKFLVFFRTFETVFFMILSLAKYFYFFQILFPFFLKLLSQLMKACLLFAILG